MATSTLQIRVDSELRKEADKLFALAGLDMSSAVRLFLRQSVIRRRLPFEVVSENPDPFWSEANQRILRESIESYERGEAKRHELIED
ncbi:MAG: type II toxin-antitoxin system RelB/DinJ family antitoxin [Lentisphaerae bacterium]|jgi:DNA-damage-inducible protein J|nr:type II toxin-antitoxin system RelB/DinJ family antitoxin [Lentisphaerota bacterium]